MPLTRIDLDYAVAGGCQTPGCKHEHGKDEIYLHGRCHPLTPVQCRYHKPTGTLIVTCAICRALIAEIAVAPLHKP